MSKPSEKHFINYGSDQLIKDAGSLSFFNPLGTVDHVDEVNVTLNGSTSNNTYGAGNAVPGICVVDYDLVPGISTNGASALNIASKKLYTFVRHQNSGSRNYDSPDLMNFAFSAVSLFSFMPAIKRAYGCAMTYSGKNRYLGEKMVEALGFNYANLIANLADFRAWYNVTVKKLNAIKVPSSWPFWTKNYLLNSMLLKDGEIDRSQIYAYRGCVIWEYNETGSNVGNLTPVFPYLADGSRLIKLTDLKNIIDPIIDAFVASEDINIMSGDILKAYGEEKCLALDLLEDDYMCVPVYNKELLDLMHNTTIYNIKRTVSDYKIIQDVALNALTFNPEVMDVVISDQNGTDTVSGIVNMNAEYLDSMNDDVNPSMVVNMSALTTMINYDENTQSYRFSSLGTEVAHDSKIVILSYGDDQLSEVFNLKRHYPIPQTNAGFRDVFKRWLVNLSTLSQFDWAPRVAVIILRTDAFSLTNSNAYTMKLYDLYNYCVIAPSDLAKLHELHVLGGFGLAD